MCALAGTMIFSQSPGETRSQPSCDLASLLASSVRWLSFEYLFRNSKPGQNVSSLFSYCTPSTYHILRAWNGMQHWVTGLVSPTQFCSTALCFANACSANISLALPRSLPALSVLDCVGYMGMVQLHELPCRDSAASRARYRASRCTRFARSAAPSLQRA
jgi:hypothetical protein